jgi:hypothetical protein
MDRFAAELEMRALAQVELSTMTLVCVTAAERRRNLDTLEHVPWREREDFANQLIGLRLAAGVTAELLRRLGAMPADRPLLDGVLMLAPTLIQCVAAVSDPWAVAAKQQRWFVGLGGQPDSCYMWRAGGALDRGRKTEGR